MKDHLMELNKMIDDKLPGKVNTQVSDGSGYYVQITYRAHWMAYQSYSLLFGTDQSCKRLAERGGFGEYELDAFYPEWRNHIVKRSV